MDRRYDNWGFVYFIARRDANVMKVGRTDSPSGRLKALGVGKTSDLYRLIITDDPGRLEHEYHEALKAARIPQSEWFVVDDDRPETSEKVEYEAYGPVDDYALVAEMSLEGQAAMNLFPVMNCYE